MSEYYSSSTSSNLFIPVRSLPLIGNTMSEYKSQPETQITSTPFRATAYVGHHDSLKVHSSKLTTASFKSTEQIPSESTIINIMILRFHDLEETILGCLTIIDQVVASHPGILASLGIQAGSNRPAPATWATSHAISWRRAAGSISWATVGDGAGIGWVMTVMWLEANGYSWWLIRVKILIMA